MKKSNRYIEGDLPNPGIEPVSPALAGRFFTTEPLGKPISSSSDLYLTREVSHYLFYHSPGLDRMTFSSLKTAKLTLTLWAFAPVHMHLLDFSQLFLL